ncbi:uncharacterized protein LOC117175376 [Belonocnema kinseyi]|uniref:uncharacterized protein LOC117175376 n=1 Tax=Belonocnema kinseyi TaxID=2817044 RepID=UPI00143CE1FD|nr:uncharacterized protein LOC117175376 [Belonocnema kinseyi]
MRYSDSVSSFCEMKYETNYPIMKCATVCLLAFCAFQAVYAWGIDDVEALRSKVLYEMLGIYNKVWQTSTDEYKAMLRQGVYIDHRRCLDIDEADLFFRKYRQLYDQCDLCFEDALKSTDPEVAKRCCRNEMAELKGLVKPTIASIKACLNKLVHDAEAARAKETSGRAPEVPRNEPESRRAKSI